MQRLHARYPFLEAARDAVATEAVDLATVVEQDRAVVDRARERVVAALEDGETGDPHREPRVELLSYPVARVLVSMVDERILVRKYARAEAATAYDRFTADFETTTELKSVDSTGLDFETVLSEFDLQAVVRETTDGYRIDVGTYLPLAEDLWEDEWHLVNRALADGEVPVTEAELLTLLQEAVRSRIEDGLPFDVPDVIEAALEDDVAEIREVLADLELTREIDTVVPELFPPCMKALLDGIQKGEHLPHHSRFAITAFLSNIGMETDEIVDLYRVNSSFGEEMTRYQTDHIRGDSSPTEYSAPSCATMQSYGDCVNKDDLCERIPHPMAYYEERIDDADDDEVEDWRDEESDGESASGD
ncbi:MULTISPECIES: DNA primase regulatory subunit PriL [Natronorubrum]|uniref:DNA primase large subunit PriL n=2 Tax=Natronorubrum bangense TaxID=61858 RepID=L9WHE9_9EURY|nr:DNA primase regulatory subunit PriL [Natronorubrum bangense]ELY48930.1 DNA primase large subunit [Natronorubrum bangense JCM 10635]QCC54042.1 DNA primase regulatory subunit PriL [Natronorubrum bangense]